MGQQDLAELTSATDRPEGRFDYQPTTWRLLNTGFQAGSLNMAIDEAILQAIAGGYSPPTLRFFGWQPACMSLGYGQSWDVIDHAYCADAGWGVVRRPTGGRAILHIDELTYSVCAPVGEPRVRGGVLESYQRLSEALLTGLREMGLNPAKAEPDPPGSGANGPICFDSPSNYEITVHGRKLIGSAQVRKRSVVLQHGTLPLYGDVTRIVQGLQFTSAEKQAAMRASLRDKAITLNEALGREMTFDEASQHLATGFRQTLNLKLEPGELSDREVEAAQRLVAEKYAHADWTKRL